MTAVAALTAATQIFLFDGSSCHFPTNSLSTAPLYPHEQYTSSPGFRALVASGAASNDLSRALILEERASTIAALEAFRDLPDNWDAQGATAPMGRSIDAALSFLKLDDSSNAWEATLHADGRAILESEADDQYLELTFGPGNHVTIASRLLGQEAEVRVSVFEDMLQRTPLAA